MKKAIVSAHGRHGFIVPIGFGALLSMVMVLNCAPFNLDSGVCREVLDTSMLFDSVLGFLIFAAGECIAQPLSTQKLKKLLNWAS